MFSFDWFSCKRQKSSRVMYMTEDSVKIETFKLPNTLKPTDVLIETHFASINELDYAHAINNYDVKFGRDFSGVVKAVGEDVTNFQKGDLVYGHQARGGSMAENIIIPSDKIRKVPNGVSLEIASFLPFGAYFAYQAFELNDLEAVRGYVKNPLLCSILIECSNISLDFDALRNTTDSLKKSSLKKIRSFLKDPETYNKLMAWIELHAESFREIAIYPENMTKTAEQFKEAIDTFRKYGETGPYIVPIKNDFLNTMEDYIIENGNCIVEESDKDARREQKRARVPNGPPMRLLSPFIISVAFENMKK